MELKDLKKKLKKNHKLTMVHCCQLSKEEELKEKTKQKKEKKNDSI
jgi:predicted transcriptional regulator